VDDDEKGGAAVLDGQELDLGDFHDGCLIPTGLMARDEGLGRREKRAEIRVFPLTKSQMGLTL
jgi:hypothetical protein